VTQPDYCRQSLVEGDDVRIGIAADHGGFGLKEDLVVRLKEGGYNVVDFGAHSLNPEDDYPDFVIPLGRAVAEGTVMRSGVGASVCENKIAGMRAALVNDHFSARQGVEDDNMNIICLGGRAIGPFSAWDVLQAFVGAEFSYAERHRRRLAKVASLEIEMAGKR